MKNKLFGIVSVITLYAVSAAAQSGNADYLKMLNYQNDALKICKKINENKIKLYEMEVELIEKGKKSQSTITKAQNSANDNVTAADKLSANVSNEKNAKNAKSAASDAKHDADKATDAIDNVSELTEDIKDLRLEIASEQSQLLLIPGYPFKD